MKSATIPNVETREISQKQIQVTNGTEEQQIPLNNYVIEKNKNVGK